MTFGSFLLAVCRPAFIVAVSPADERESVAGVLVTIQDHVRRTRFCESRATAATAAAIGTPAAKEAAAAAAYIDRWVAAIAHADTAGAQRAAVPKPSWRRMCRPNLRPSSPRVSLLTS